MNIPHIVNRKFVIIAAIVAGIGIASLYPAYVLLKNSFNNHFNQWGDRLVELEKRGQLSREFGAAWQDVLTGEEMEKETGTFIARDSATGQGIAVVDGIAVRDYPSLSIVARLNEVHAYANTIRINDRAGRTIAVIRTDHTRAKIDQFPEVLKKALIAAEDGGFYDNALGFEFDSFLRAIGRAVIRSAATFSIASPRGTSTITQQVAKLFVSHLDESGNRQVSRNVDRKVRELRLAAALRKMYPADDIFEVYLNHCIASDFGLIGVKDIALGLFGKELGDLTDAECIYIARMVKWGRNIHPKVARQCRIDMPRMAESLGWSKQYRASILEQIDTMTFLKPKQIQTESGHLVDLANEFWLEYLKTTNGNDGDFLSGMDLVDPNSLIRKKGNLTITLTIDLPLQRFLEKLVRERGFGQDTVIYTDLRIGSLGENIARTAPPEDTVRTVSVLNAMAEFTEPNSSFRVMLHPGDTLITNIRYQKKKPGVWRRSCYFYTRREIRVDGQYYAYCIIDSRTGKLLAYCSRDKIGSRLACLLHNRVPNGSSTAKPILNALNFDLGIFPACARWTDDKSVPGEVPWNRTIIMKDGKPHEVSFTHSAVPGQGYVVHNHNFVFEGCQYIFDHLSTSNNVLGVETVYRLNRAIFDPSGRVNDEAFSFAQLLYRIDALERIKKQFKSKTVTGVRLYKELARIVGVDVDTMTAYGKRVPVSDSLYSVALGTLEMTLYEQVHLFNMLYNNDVIERPAEHPSLFIDSIHVGSSSIFMAEHDTVKRYHPFSDVNTLRPTYLGMHKRLVSNQWDGLADYDIPYALDPMFAASISDSTFNPNTFTIDQPLSNYAKSGTTDDVLRPFNADVTSAQRTNYGLWNATIRIDLSKLTGDTAADIRDITIACIAECNTHYTGERDGKTLHKYVSRELLLKAGEKTTGGFYAQYEHYLKNVTPDSLKYCGDLPDSGNAAEAAHPVFEAGD